MFEKILSSFRQMPQMHLLNPTANSSHSQLQKVKYMCTNLSMFQCSDATFINIIICHHCNCDYHHHHQSTVNNTCRMQTKMLWGKVAGEKNKEKRGKKRTHKERAFLADSSSLKQMYDEMLWRCSWNSFLHKKKKQILKI